VSVDPAPRFRLGDDGEDGTYVEWTHTCDSPGGRWWCEEVGGDDPPALLPVGPGGWTVVQRDPLTVTPSILCHGCGCHGFITDGTWHPA
jgi:hypothetical protein